MNPETPQGAACLHAARLSLPLPSLLPGQGILLQPSRSELRFCKASGEKRSALASGLTCSCTNATELGRTALSTEVRIWPKYLLEAAIQLSLLLKREASPERTRQNPDAAVEAPCPGRQCLCTDELVVMEQVTVCGWLEKQKSPCCSTLV